MSLAFELSRSLVQRAQQRLSLRRLTSEGDQSHLPLHAADGTDVGWVDVYAGGPNHGIDRLLHIWIGSPGARMDTNLIWMFAKEHSLVPHYHAQAIHMPNDRYVYNFDVMPRVDLAVHEGYWQEVFGPVSEAHGKAARDPERAGTRLPMPPTTAIFMSPWGMAAMGAPQEELEKAWPLATSYLDRCLSLAERMTFQTSDTQAVAARHKALIDAHTSDAIDPRGWGGIERTCGAQGKESIKKLMREPLA